MENIELLLSELEGEILDGKKTVFSQTSLTVNGDRVLGILTKIRECFPEELRQAKIIVEERDNIRQEAKIHAEALYNDVKQKELRLISESSITKQATQEAEHIKREAMSYRDRTMYQVNQILDEHLNDVENSIANVLGHIRNSREHLRGDMFRNK